MLSWIAEHHAVVNSMISIVTVLVWIIYLQLFINSLLRQRRSNILINRSAGNDDKARCVVVNMGAEPIYLANIIADIDIGGHQYSAIVTDRDEMTKEDLTDPLKATTQGPLESGQYRDVGSLHELIWRALRNRHLEGRDSEVEGLILTVAAVSGHSAYIAAGRQKFYVRSRYGQRVYLPASTDSEQLRSYWERRRIRGRLDRALKEEAGYPGDDQNA
ncbi:MAG TPA: hypothetical protein VKA18_10435 [Alphaproteobacteria bacterium]|nr:hypothetical protein [Alphaproteobacteria bacterium]